jgi:hypothetical protein
MNIGTVVGNTSPQEYKFYMHKFAASLGDLVTVEIETPSSNSGTTSHKKTETVTVWGRITELQRYNPFLPAEAGVELADTGVDLLDTVLSNTRDQIEATVLVLGKTAQGNYLKLMPLDYPIQPGATVTLPPKELVKEILIGEEPSVSRLKIGTLIGRGDIDVTIKTNSIVARHMAILAMTGGGKTVAARRIIRELLHLKYPLLIIDPHGDYLGFWEKKNLFKENEIKIYYPHIKIYDQTRNVVGFLVKQMTQGFTEPQDNVFQKALEESEINDGTEMATFMDQLIQKVANLPVESRQEVSKNVVKRQLNAVKRKIDSMRQSNEALRNKLKGFPFEEMPDPCVAPHEFIRPGRLSILYLGGYDHLTQSTIVSLVLTNLFEKRSSMTDEIPPFLTVVEEAHNFIPSKGEGQDETPSVDILRKIITEGRKFGTGLLLVSQRPSRLDETTLSQCNTFLIFRLVNPRDQSFVEKVMENLSKSDSRLLPGFGPGQGIISGQAVRFPLIVKIDFDKELVTKSLGDEDFISAARNWEKSPDAQSIPKGEKIEKRLKEAEKE